MSFYAQVTSTVDLGGGNSVVLRKLTYGETADCLTRATKPNGLLDNVLYTRLTLETGLVSWSGPDFDGRPASAENLRDLPARIGGKLAQASRELNRDMEDEEGN